MREKYFNLLPFEFTKNLQLCRVRGILRVLHAGKRIFLSTNHQNVSKICQISILLHGHFTETIRKENLIYRKKYTLIILPYNLWIVYVSIMAGTTKTGLTVIKRLLKTNKVNLPF